MLTRRDILATLGALPSSGALYAGAASVFPRRLLGRTGRMVVPLALGGQASLQWTKPGIDPADIIVRAIELGLNYLDTANAYGPSQMNYGEAFRRLRLTPADIAYDATGRQALFLATKTTRRFARNPGSQDPTAVDELKRSLTQIFGDGKGFIPDGAYLDSIQVHNLTNPEQVDQVYEGFSARGSKMPERIGALAALVDFRDGTNHTGLNPEHRHWVRHIGLTGHLSSPILMSAIRRDVYNIFDTLLVALNANDRLASSHQNNVLPLAVARGLGVIAMKIFADGAYYHKEPRFSRTPDDVYLQVGKNEASNYSDLVRYPLSLPGVSCAIIGTGMIQREDPTKDQIVANLAAALKDLPSSLERQRIEKDSAARHGVKTNYFQEKTDGRIIQPTKVALRRDGDRAVVEWNTAFAGPEPLRSYEVKSGGKVIASLPFRPQLTETPYSLVMPGTLIQGDAVEVLASEKNARDVA